MQEDTKNTMQERGDTIGIGTSIQNDFGDLAPHSYEFSGNPQTTPEKDDQEPKDRFQIAEENFSKLRQDLKDKKITQDEFASKAQSNMLTIDGVLWSPGARTGTWHKYENGAWVPAEPPREKTPTNPEITENRTNKPDEEGGSLQDQEGDVTTLGEAIILSNSSPDTWGSADRQWFDQHRNYIAKAVEQGRFPEHIAKKLGILNGNKGNTSQEANTSSQKTQTIEADDRWKDFAGTDWDKIGKTTYADLARQSMTDPSRRQTFEYWVGNDEKNIPSKLALLAEEGMSQDEISALLKLSPTENSGGITTERVVAEARVPEPAPEEATHPDVEFPMSFAEANLQLKEGRVRRAEEIKRKSKFDKDKLEGKIDKDEEYVPRMTQEEFDHLVQQETELNTYLESMETAAREQGFFDDITQQSREIELELREFTSLENPSTAEEKRKRDAVMGRINKWNLRKGFDRNVPQNMNGLRQSVFNREKERLLARLEDYEQGVEAPNTLIDAKLERLSPEEQLKAVRGLLTRVESLDRPINQQSTTVKDQIEYLRLHIQEHIAYPDIKSKIDVRVLREARARINLHEFYVTWRNFDLGSDEAKKDITNKLLNLGSPEDIPDGDDFAVLLKGRIDPINGEHNPYEHTDPFMEGIPVGEMANRLQRSAAIGTEIAGHGGVPRRVKWNWNERAEKSTDNRLLKDRLRDGLNGETETAYRLASRSLKVLGVIGTLDLPVMEGNHIKKAPSSPLGGYIYFQSGRYAALEKRLDPSGTSLDDPGPILSMPIAVGFGSDALRSATYKDAEGKTRHLVNDDVWTNIEKARARGAKPSELKALTLDAIRLDPYNPTRSQAEGHLIDFTNVAYEQLAPNFLENYYKKDVTMRLTVRSWLLTSTWKVDELLDVDKMDFKRSAFNIVDPSRDLQIRQAWVIGVVSEAIFALKGSETKNTLLHPSNWEKFKSLVTDGENNILTKEQFKKVEQYCREEGNADPKVLQRQFMAEFTRGVLPTSQ